MIVLLMLLMLMLHLLPSQSDCTRGCSWQQVHTTNHGDN